MSLKEGLLIKLVSLFLAILIWASVLVLKEHQRTVNIPLQIILPPNMAVVSGAPTSVNVTLSASRIKLKSFLNQFESFDIDLRGHREGLVYISLKEELRSLLPKEILLINVHPSTIPLKLERVISLVKEVKPRLIGQLSRGQRVKKVVVKPSYVMVRGPRNIVQALQFVTTEPVDLSLLQDKTVFSLSVPIDIDENLGLSLPEVSIVDVWIYTTKIRKKR